MKRMLYLSIVASVLLSSHGAFCAGQVTDFQIEGKVGQTTLYAGRNDPEGLANPNRDFVNALKENGFPVEYIEDDEDHDNRVAQRLGDFIEFLSNSLEWQ